MTTTSTRPSGGVADGASDAEESPLALDPGAARGRIRGLDGLRAFAVVAVIAYHLAPWAVPGGFVGVDVFFVVSGFLITTLLVREAAGAGRLSMPAFWLRRSRRLLPALGAVVVASLLAARLVDPDLLVGSGRQVLGALTFSTNWLAVGAGTSYFDQTQPELLAPLWSLAIEEQFYLLWPLLLVVLLVVARSWRHRARTALVGAVLSAVLMAVLYRTGSDPTRVYYGTDTHATGLLLGAAGAFAWAGGTRLRPGGALARWAPPAALGGLVLLVLLLHGESGFTYRGGLAAAAGLALVAVLGCVGERTPYVRALEAPPLRWVGERSYGLYLWHWPVILVVDALIGAQVGTGAWWRGAAVAVVVTVVLAWASYRWIEAPVRRDGWRATAQRVSGAVRGGRRAPRVVAAVCALAVLGAGVSVATAPDRTSAQVAVEQGQAALARAAAAAEAAAAAAAESQAAAAANPGVDISAFGDSVLSAAAGAVLARYPAMAVDAKPIRKWVDAVPLVQQAAVDGTLRPIVVLDLGTNGGFHLDGAEQAFRTILDIVGPDRQVVVVTVVGISYWVPDTNATLAAIAADHPHVHLADWAAAVHDQPGLLHSDRTHPNLAGVQVYGDVLAGVLTGLGRPPVATATG